MESLVIAENEKVLIVAPHPDDECIGAGALLIQFPSNCTVIVMTNGEQGQGKKSINKLRQQRKKEFEEEMKLANITTYYFFEVADGQLINHLDVLNDFDLSIFNKIFVTGNNDNHADHTAALVCVLRALERQKQKKDVFLYEVHNPIQNPTHYIDITNIINAKIELVQCHKSQLENFPYDEHVRVSGLYRGMILRQPYKFYEVYAKYDDEDVIDVSMEREMQKFKQFYWILCRWLELRQKGINITQNIKQHNTIAIYGYAELGRLLVEDIKASPKELLYIFDKKLVGTDNIICPDEIIEKPDCVIVTAIMDFQTIKNEMIEKGFDNIYSLKELVISEKSSL